MLAGVMHSSLIFNWCPAVDLGLFFKRSPQIRVVVTRYSEIPNYLQILFQSLITFYLLVSGSWVLSLNTVFSLYHLPCMESWIRTSDLLLNRESLYHWAISIYVPSARVELATFSFSDWHSTVELTRLFVILVGFEPTTCSLWAKCSNRWATVSTNKKPHHYCIGVVWYFLITKITYAIS